MGRPIAGEVLMCDDNPSGSDALTILQSVHHKLRQSTTTAIGLALLLEQGVLGFASEDQRMTIHQLLTQIQKIETAYQDLDDWLNRTS